MIWFNFNPRTPCGVRPGCPRPNATLAEFQSTHPVRGATRVRWRSGSTALDFNPRTPCGVRRQKPPPRSYGTHFNPRTPCGVRQIAQQPPAARSPFQSTHPVRGATCGHAGQNAHWFDFNPRTPCGVRLFSRTSFCVLPYFNPRTPCGVRQGVNVVEIPQDIFQSTHPVRGATCHTSDQQLQGQNFNPRTPCGVRPYPMP